VEEAVARALSQEEAVVAAKDVVKTYRRGSVKVEALKGVTLTIPRHKMTLLKGRSGSGKTTMLNLIAGLDRPDSGSIRVLGREITGMSDAELTRMRRQEVGLVFQTFALLPTYTAYENVDLALRIAGVPFRERDRRVREVLALVGLSRRMTHRPFELSGGEQQRVAIARALAPRPTLILADEPTGELDSATGMAIVRLFRRLIEEEGVTVCLTTHDAAVMALADLTYEIVDGRVAGEHERGDGASS
jgi:putative ABC transport system ATP-binding protein